MKNTYRIENDKLIKGISLPVFIHNLHYHLTDIHIYEDGKIDCWELVDFDGFIKKIQSGWIKTNLPKGEKVFAFPLGNFQTKEFNANRTENDLIKEVRDIIDRFQGKKTAEQFCIDAFKNFVEKPTIENRNELKRTYELVAAHNRRFLLGDMDVDDLPIQIAIYGERIFKESRKAQIQEKLIREHYLKGIKI
ncbi:DUF7638 domain-containing protein [Winogradskyella sp. HB-48]|uniref:DUF7638 domain-containing protein n=1 Tax=Winogradskyella sp. HB-48 TaxID=3416808 RepID=UPI003CF2A952